MEKAPDPDLGTELISKERYTSVEFMRLEQERMWKRVWLLAGRESDIRTPGDYFTFELGPESILVVRQENGAIAARYNVCRHRGNRLCEPGLGHAAAFPWRVHGWVYDTSGSLKFVPDAETFPQGVNKEPLGLRELQCDTWGGFVWINMNPDAEPLREYLGMIPGHLDPYHFEAQSIINDVTLEVDCN